MDITPQALRAANIGFNTVFNKAYSEYKPLYDQIATVVPSTTDAETYAWLGDIAGMREWIGDREIQNLSASSYTIRNKNFELTISVPRNAIEDDKLGLYNPSVQMLAQSAAAHPDDLVFQLLPGGFTTECFDGLPFFSQNHKVGKNKVSNMTNAKLTAASYSAARAAMMSQRNSKNRPLNLVPNLLVVPPALESTAREILIADIVNGTKNIMQGTATPLMAPQLAGYDSMWFLLCTTRPIKPFIYQERKAAKFVSKTADTDDNVFNSNENHYGADSRGNAGYALWQMAYGSDGRASS